MRLTRRVARLLVVPTLALGIALVLDPARAGLAVHVWLLVSSSVALLVLLDVVRTTYPATTSPFETSLLPTYHAALGRPATLVQLEREISMARSAAFDVHYRLRPTLVELAAGLLSSRRGIDVAREPERARVLLGNELWELVRPDRSPPLERMGPGIDEERLHRAVSALEHL